MVDIYVMKKMMMTAMVKRMVMEMVEMEMEMVMVMAEMAMVETVEEMVAGCLKVLYINGSKVLNLKMVNLDG